jgi:tetratricopeptide (TPR) repeat protein
MLSGKFNLNYKFDSKLREVPEDRESMQSYVNFLLSRTKIAKPSDVGTTRAMVKILGEIGAYGKILGKPEMAIEALRKSLALIDERHMGVGIWAVHTLRYGDALRFKKDYLEAEAAFRSVIEMADRHQEVKELEDFAWQHLGKLKYDEGDLKTANEYFEKAKSIRIQKGIKELLDSTEYAIRTLHMKAINKKKY